MLQIHLKAAEIGSLYSFNEGILEATGQINGEFVNYCKQPNIEIQMRRLRLSGERM
ncbi:hypothetical protein [Paenibacillus luteus]|uniref:hypothetical protein n=1 Tax=Paenibacillus luteus TaxID=2545753 RepID=UPI001376121F|nr:hypothetical protein [Paenibacillus luteus]